MTQILYTHMNKIKIKKKRRRWRKREEKKIPD
jgi:hypothetical protein